MLSGNAILLRNVFPEICLRRRVSVTSEQQTNKISTVFVNDQA